MLQIMPITIHYGDLVLVADTPEEAARLAGLLQGIDTGSDDDAGGHSIGEISAAADESVAWTPELFEAFLRRLGDSQKTALAVLVTHQYVTDEHLRKELGVSGNQALAGVLSGISKQAAALGFSARNVFNFENFRKVGRRRSLYRVAEEFAEITAKMNWPAGKVPHNG
jgi:hypothetical protein